MVFMHLSKSLAICLKVSES